MKTIDDYVFKMPDDRSVIEDAVYSEAFASGINHLYKAFGWQGGTIHQIIDGIMDYKRKWNQGSCLIK